MRAFWPIVLITACGGTDASEPRQTTFGADRPADLKAPATLTDGKQYPLIVALHGFTSTGFVHATHFQLRTLTDADAALVIAPDGTTNSQGQQFWNADPACCDLEGQNPDDVGYLGTLIEDISAEWPVDKNAVFVIGHSNGGYMAYRMACERADLIAGVVSLAGNAASTPSSCNPTRALSVLHMHGSLDATVPYTGGSGVGGIGAVSSVEQWATHDGCGTTRTPTITLDLDTQVAGAETRGETTADCPPGIEVELWTMEGSSHVPFFSPPFATTILDWLVAHKR